MSLLSVRKQEIINEIEKSIVRADIVDGVYESATFKFGKNEFRIVSDVFDDAGNRTGSAIYKNGELYSGSIVSNGRYRNVALYNGASLMEHQLLAICLIPGATSQLLNEEENNVVNHKTIARASIEARERKHEYDLQCELYSWGGEEPDESLLENPYVPPCDVRDLEVCTSSENYSHGAFIKTFNLYDISISAKDVPLLKKLMIDNSRVASVINEYKDKGRAALIDMFGECIVRI